MELNQYTLDMQSKPASAVVEFPRNPPAITVMRDRILIQTFTIFGFVNNGDFTSYVKFTNLSVIVLFLLWDLFIDIHFHSERGNQKRSYSKKMDLQRILC